MCTSLRLNLKIECERLKWQQAVGWSTIHHLLIVAVECVCVSMWRNRASIMHTQTQTHIYNVLCVIVNFNYLTKHHVEND